MTSHSGPSRRSSAETKARIILVAQDIFSSKGYSHSGLREIAKLAQVAPSLVIKYFGTKAKLYEEALVAAIIPIQSFQGDRARIGEAIVASVLDAGSMMLAPPMIALALGDPESRDITMRVVKQHIIDPMTEWLDSETAKARALNILAMTTGFSIYHRNMQPELTPEEKSDSAQLFMQTLQSVVDKA